MKTLLLSLSLLPVAFVLGGCGDSHAQARNPDAEPVPASTYKAGHGVQLTETGRKFIGLKTGEVATHAFEGKDTAAIPADALLRTVKGDFVYVANGEWFLRTPVKVGRADATHIEIADGLYEGDTIVTEGVRGLSLAEIQALNGGVGCADGH